MHIKELLLGHRNPFQIFTRINKFMEDRFKVGDSKRDSLFSRAKTFNIKFQAKFHIVLQIQMTKYKIKI